MSRNFLLFTIVLTALIATCSVHAAPPSASIVSPATPLQADQLQKLQFIIKGTDSDNDLRLCEMYVDGIRNGDVFFNSSSNNATAEWTWAFSTPGHHTRKSPLPGGRR